MLTVAIFIFDEVEVLDFAGPFEVFSTASRVRARAGAEAPFRVVTIAKGPGPVSARGGLSVSPRHHFGEHPDIDVLIVPGGDVTRELGDAQVIQWIAEVSTKAQLTASVCTGAFLLAAAGLLEGRRVTTHWEDVDDLRQQFPRLRVEGGERWIDEGPIATSAGISAGIDLCLHLVGRLEGDELAVRTARQMDYPWE